MDVGSTLRTARERHGLTLAQLATTTKIPVGILQSLEQNAFERVPRGIFVRGYLRAYAAEVGLDPQEIVDQFLRESGDLTEVDTAANTGTELPLDDQIEVTPIDPDLRPSGRGLGYLLMIAALLVAFVAVSRWDDDEAASNAVVAEQEADDAAAEGDSVDLATVQPVATAGRTIAGDAPDAGGADSTSQFVLQANGECWVEATVDGRRVIYRLMQPGERTTIESGQEIILRVGDPGALTYFVNGEPGEPLGRPGVPVTVRLTKPGEVRS